MEIKKYKIYWCSIEFSGSNSEKLRPCIIIGMKDDSVKVLPLTSVAKERPLVLRISKINGVDAYANFSDTHWISKEKVKYPHERSSLLQNKAYLKKNEEGLTFAQQLVKLDKIYDLALDEALRNGGTIDSSSPLYYKHINKNERLNKTPDIKQKI